MVDTKSVIVGSMCVGKDAIQVPIETLQRTICPTDQDDRKVKQG